MRISGLLGCALVVTVLVGSVAAWAQEGPKGYACVFETGTSWSYDNGTFKSKPSSVLTFEITEIDLEGQSARLQTNGTGGAAKLKIVRSINANHFLEVVNEGFLNLTTIYDKDPTTGTSPAVHSRHFGVIGQPVFAQYAGTCTAK